MVVMSPVNVTSRGDGIFLNIILLLKSFRPL